MANAGVCSVKLTLAGELVSFSKAAFYTLDADGNPRRVRHRRHLLRSEYAAVVALPPGTDLDPERIRTALEHVKDFSSPPEGLLPEGSDWGFSTSARRGSRAPGRALTGEGGLGYLSPPAVELAMLLTGEAGASTFYDTVESRRARRLTLVAQLTESDPDELERLVSELRSREKSRTGAVMLAVDAALAGHPSARALLAAALIRPDDPAAALRYFNEAYPDAAAPAAFKKGLADAAVHLYTEPAALRFDRARRRGVEDRSKPGAPVRFADVIRFAHPAPSSDAQSALFAALIHSRFDPNATPLLHTRARLVHASDSERAEILAEALAEARAARAAGRLPAHPLSRLSIADLSAFYNNRSEIRRVAYAAAEQDLLVLRTVHREIRAEDRSTRRRIKDAEASGDAEKLRTARRDMRRVRSSWLWEEYQGDLNQALAARRAANALPGSLPPEVWEVALPRMSVAEMLGSLAAMRRSGGAEALTPHVASRLEDKAAWAASTARLPDILRAARGAAIAEARLAATISRGVAWTSLAPSPFEPALESVLTGFVAERIPEIPGRVLVLVDGSGSMGQPVSARSADHRAAGYQGLACDEVASFVAASLASRCRPDQIDLYTYDTEPTPVALVDGALASTRKIASSCKGGGTDTFGVLEKTWSGHDLTVILTDEQFGSFDTEPFVPESGHVVTVNLAGHRAALADHPRVTRLAGWSESLFDRIAEIATPAS